MDISVVGAGYVGTVTAACLARLGHRVVLLEADPAKVARLVQGAPPFHEPGLPELLRDVVGSGALTATTDEAAALEDRDAILVCVGTPLGPEGEADLRQVEAVSRAIARHAPTAPVILRSTMPLGAHALLATWLARPALKDVATNPEFLRQGSAVADFLAPTRIVVGTPGGLPNRASEAVLGLYATIAAPLVTTDLASADMIKNAANAFLALKLSFINEVADLCEAYGAEVEDVLAGVTLDPRIGAAYLRPGIGFGGSCLPKELANLVRLGRARSLPMHTFGAATRANDERAGRIADRLEFVVGPLAGCEVAILGLAFKPGTDDIRYSPAVSLARELAGRGARVRGHDPEVRWEAVTFDGFTRVETIEAAIEGAELVVLATEWPVYRDLEWGSLAKLARRPVLFDGRNALDRPALETAGWRVIRIGTPVRAAFPAVMGSPVEPAEA